VLVASAAEESYEFILPAGTYELRAEKDCAQLAPAEVQSLTVEPGRSAEVRWEVRPGQAIEVVTSIPGASIRLDGAETGLFSPATITCVNPGELRVSVRLLGADALPDSEQTVAVADSAARVEFTFAPRAQPRTALLEIFTATFCPNCGPADAAAALLWERIGPQQGYIGLQVHTYWGGRDSIATPTSLGRNAFYGDQERLGIPAALFGGTLLHRGAGQMTTEEIADLYTTFVDSVKAMPTPVALYWLEAHRTPGVEVAGTARVMLAGGLADADTCRIWAAIYKDDLRTRGIEGPNQLFRHSVRVYQSGGTLAARGVAATGDWADVEFSWDASQDTRRSGALWSEEAMGIAVFVQNMATKEILQAAHAPLP
jgi:hypothetical protein